jgi:hypothetical protein
LWKTLSVHVIDDSADTADRLLQLIAFGMVQTDVAAAAGKEVHRQYERDAEKEGWGDTQEAEMTEEQKRRGQQGRRHVMYSKQQHMRSPS